MKWASWLLLLGACACQGEADGAPDAGIRLVPAIGGARFSQPVLAIQAPGDATRFYVVEKAGRVLRAATGQPQVVVDIRDRVNSGPSEAGLLGVAFHPRFAETREVFLSYTAGASPMRSRVVRMTSPDGGLTIDPGTEELVLTVDQPYANHNGGHILFGPDGFLYFGLGDGGSAGDPHNHGQDTQTLLGSMLRIDISQRPYQVPADNPFVAGGGAPEIFAYGLRNPWRFSFDPSTGALWAADVGQNIWEEVDVIVRGGNYGWRIREGRHCFDPDPCDRTGLIDPVAEYDHSRGDVSITGGFVYRGKAIPSLQGKYVFGDYASGRIFTIPATEEGAPHAPQLLMRTSLAISSFAEGSDRELYVIDLSGGQVHRLTPK